jgi:hypothetical protein
MTTARNLIKSRIKSGNTLIGVGCYSAALEGNSYNKVLKVGNTSVDPWLEYYEAVIKPNQGNSHIPKVYSLHVDSYHDYYVAVVEKLWEHDEREEDRLDGLDELEELVKATCEGKYSDAEFMRESARVDECLGDFHPSELYRVCSEIHSLIQSSYSECDGEYDLNLDLHTKNFLYRADGTLVINDPISHTDMEDVDDLSIWADEQDYHHY